MACTKPFYFANLLALGMIVSPNPQFTIVNKPYAKKPQPNAPGPEEHWGDEPSLAAFVAGLKVDETLLLFVVAIGDVRLEMSVYHTGSRNLEEALPAIIHNSIVQNP